MNTPAVVNVPAHWRRVRVPDNAKAIALPGAVLYRHTSVKLTVMVSQSPNTGHWHLSISHPFRYPSWDEIKGARYELVPHHVTMAMMLPPPSEFVNIHENCFHMHECLCEYTPKPLALP